MSTIKNRPGEGRGGKLGTNTENDDIDLLCHVFVHDSDFEKACGSERIGGDTIEWINWFTVNFYSQTIFFGKFFDELFTDDVSKLKLLVV